MPGSNSSALSAALSTLQSQVAGTPQFVSSSSMTVDQLLLNFPAGPAYRGKYARVSDYGGYVDRVVRCDYDSQLNYHFWTPTQPEYGRSMSITNSNLVLMALKSPPSVVLTGDIPLGTTRTFTINLANRRPGELIEVKASLATLAGSLNILGTGLGTGIGILLGGYQKYLVDGSSGSLSLVRLV